MKTKALERLLGWISYLDPASNPGSKPQRLGVTNCKSSTSDKLQTFRTISCKFLTKNYEITLFVLFWRGISSKRNHRTFQANKEKNQWLERKCPVLIAAWLYPLVPYLPALWNQMDLTLNWTLCNTNVLRVGWWGEYGCLKMSIMMRRHFWTTPFAKAFKPEWHGWCWVKQVARIVFSCTFKST